MARSSTSEASPAVRRFAIRELAARDKAAWLELWRGYCDFYQVAVADDVT